jgi:hypothetical protein
MTWPARLVEKITGSPHRHDIADSVSMAAAGLSRSIDRLSANLKPYSQSEYPLVALMTDVFNRRQMKSKLGRG